MLMGVLSASIHGTLTLHNKCNQHDCKLRELHIIKQYPETRRQSHAYMHRNLHDFQRAFHLHEYIYVYIYIYIFCKSLCMYKHTSTNRGTYYTYKQAYKTYIYFVRNFPSLNIHIYTSHATKSKFDIHTLLDAVLPRHVHACMCVHINSAGTWHHSWMFAQHM
jgi:hypothetical protein